MAKTKYFKTESKKLLELMINSIYTHKDIFLRELISNASDAIDRRHYLSLTNDQVQAEENYEITLEPNETKRTLTITDNGIGMTEKELIDSLGTIAESGSKTFMEKLEKKDMDIIGQFGVGFYSAFMVTNEVIIETRSPFADQGYRWVSKGVATYQIAPMEKEDIGTKIILKLRDDHQDNEEDYTQYLNTHTLKQLVKQYSDYIRYPITLPVEKETDNKKEMVIETLNSMVPIWKKHKQDIKEEELHEFYKQQFNDFEDPLKVIHTQVEGKLTYTSLLFIPKNPPHDFYTDKYEKGLTLYSKGVFIMEKNKELIPDYYRFVRGLIDSADLTLNISREMLQHNRQLKEIAAHIEKKITSELEKMLKNEREAYNRFFNTYGINLKYGIYDHFGAKKDLLKDLIMFKTTKSDDYITLNEYVERKQSEQKAIYYAAGKTKAQIMSLPQMESLKEKDYEVLLFTEDIDEFMTQILSEYKDLPFKSIQQGETDLLDETGKEDLKTQEKTYKNLLKTIKKHLENKVKDVKLSGRLKQAPVCLVSGEGLSLEMEKVLKKLPDANKLQAERILEINPNHDLFKALTTVHEKAPERIKDYAHLLYSQALLIEGFTLDDPVEFSDLMVKLMVEATKQTS